MEGPRVCGTGHDQSSPVIQILRSLTRSKLATAQVGWRALALSSIVFVEADNQLGSDQIAKRRQIICQAEVGAAERVAVPGGKTVREVAAQMKIDGLGGVDSLLNKVNPIGPRRFDLLPEGYTR